MPEQLDFVPLLHKLSRIEVHKILIVLVPKVHIHSQFCLGHLQPTWSRMAKSTGCWCFCNLESNSFTSCWAWVVVSGWPYEALRCVDWHINRSHSLLFDSCKALPLWMYKTKLSGQLNCVGTTYGTILKNGLLFLIKSNFLSRLPTNKN
jgi:hypothetical protein